MNNEERKRNQDDFTYDKTSIIIATNAFGMGIDKSNVRFVIHYNMPQSMENYYQEAGRAGRDGLRSECIMLYSPNDVMTQKWLLEHKTFEDIDPEVIEKIKDRDARRLRYMENYCQTTTCLRNYILTYFGEESTGDCQDCGNCSREYKTVDMTREAKCVANCVYETKGRYALTIVVCILIGSKRGRVIEKGGDHYKTYGVLKGTKKDLIKRLISQMIEDGYLIKTDGSYSAIKFGDQIDKLKDSETHVFVRYFEEKHSRYKNTKVRKTDTLSSTGLELFSILRSLRKDIAREEDMPTYIIFSDRTLLQMCLLLPQSEEEMLVVSGVGRAKYDKYGERFIAEIRKFVSNNDKPVSHSDMVENSEINLKENLKRRNKGGNNVKREFYLLKDEAEKFEYEEYLEINEMRKKLNEIRNKSEVRVIRNMDIMAYLSDMGYVSERIIDRDNLIVITEEGKKLGLKYEKQLDWRKKECLAVVISKQAQEIIVKHYTK